MLVAIPENMHNRSSQVMGAVKASLLQEDRYKTCMSNLRGKTTNSRLVQITHIHGAKNVSCIKCR